VRAISVSGKKSCIGPLYQVTLLANSFSTYKSRISVLYGSNFVDNVINTILVTLNFLECVLSKKPTNFTNEFASDIATGNIKLYLN